MPVPDGSGMIVGHVVGPDGELPVAGALVRARAHDAAWLVEAHSLADGALSLPIRSRNPVGDQVLNVTVEVFDDQGTVQAGAQVVVRPGETVAVTLVVAELDGDRFRHEPPVVPPFLAGEAATVLRQGVVQRVDRGDLPEGAMAEVDEALRPLEWLSSLQADAQSTLRGEPDAADRLRLALPRLCRAGARRRARRRPRRRARARNGTGDRPGRGHRGRQRPPGRRRRGRPRGGHRRRGQPARGRPLAGSLVGTLRGSPRRSLPHRQPCSRCAR